MSKKVDLIAEASAAAKDTTATAAALREVLTRVQARQSEVSSRVRSIDHDKSGPLATAASQAEVDEIMAERERLGGERKALAGAWQRLEAAILRAKHREAVGSADRLRSDLAEKVAAAEAAYQTYRNALAEAEAAGELIRKAAQAAGGHADVYAEPSDARRLAALLHPNPVAYRQGHPKHAREALVKSLCGSARGEADRLEREIEAAEATGHPDQSWLERAKRDVAFWRKKLAA